MNPHAIFQDVLQDIVRVTYVSIFNEVLDDLYDATHCHGCSNKYNVCFFGYHGEYCAKRCWRRTLYSEENGFEDPYGCKLCDNPYYTVSYANSKYHARHRSSLNASGFYWPMKSPSIPCHNKCIQETPVIQIKGYNSH
jgi:hypothetical protein